MTRSLVSLILLASAARSPAAQTPRWSADPPHSAVAFRVRHLGITWVNGTFKQWTAELTYDPAKPEAATVTAHIQAGTLDTGNERRDDDVRTNYLATDSFPETPHGRRTAFSATTTVRRQDYGIILNRFMERAQIVGDEVRVTIDVEAVEHATTP
jgi:polyisoprenoid-binding protein YceI